MYIHNTNTLNPNDPCFEWSLALLFLGFFSDPEIEEKLTGSRYNINNNILYIYISIHIQSMGLVYLHGSQS